MAIILITSFLLGVAMKIADLLDEHQLQLFKGANLLFGITWGILGVLLIKSNNLTANMYVGLLMSYVLRGKIDYLNHGIAATIIIFTFIYLLNGQHLDIQWPTLLFFFFALSVSGIVHDFLTHNIKKQNVSVEMVHTLISYIGVPLLYSIYTCQTIFFYSFLLFGIAYEITRTCGSYFIARQKQEDKQ